MVLTVSSSLPTRLKVVQRLAQIVAGGGKESGLAEIGLLGLLFGSLQSLRRILASGDVFERQQDFPRG